MLFNSFTFILFFMIVLALYHGPFSWRWKKGMLLVASYIFYAAWNPPFVILLWISTVIDWYAARGIDNAKRRAVRRGCLLLSLCVNLGMLAFFKYGNFLLENFVVFARSAGIDYTPAQYSIVLPVGISFYTFQTLSYTLDVYRGKLRPWESFLDFALFVTFFPQLVAGPIVRAATFLPQLTAAPKVTARYFGWGMSLLVFGLFEKAVVADGVFAPVVQTVYATTPGLAPSFEMAWIGTLAFAGQIFCDFAGYSTCAIGVAMCLGFALPDNFRCPYAALGFSDFWSRWHISLSSWLRDYLYIPLGGNRDGVLRTYVNLMLTMLIGGLWHGASWAFVVWGGLHGMYLIVERLLRNSLVADMQLWRRTVGKLLIAAVTFIAVCYAWVFFRAQTFEQAFTIMSAMCGVVGTGTPISLANADKLASLAAIIGILILQWNVRNDPMEAVVARMPQWFWAGLMAFMIYAIITFPREDNAFIYFQF